MTSKARQVGNAVPPLLAEQFGRAFKRLDEQSSINPSAPSFLGPHRLEKPETI
jgi:hypothetical protein